MSCEFFHIYADKIYLLFCSKSICYFFNHILQLFWILWDKTFSGKSVDDKCLVYLQIPQCISATFKAHVEIENGENTMLLW